jgi:DNA-binding CsgD family transcriptional regulator
VSVHISNILRKLNVTSRYEAADAARTIIAAPTRGHLRGKG